ncbi:hypothetical protein GCM10010294_35450 [Streptomyces griseoloalbus]|nr:hypothetical protein GCM10010294_35450 [Streptomyces griseoloalbus]
MWSVVLSQEMIARPLPRGSAAGTGAIGSVWVAIGFLNPRPGAQFDMAGVLPFGRRSASLGQRLTNSTARGANHPVVRAVCRPPGRMNHPLG